MSKYASLMKEVQKKLASNSPDKEALDSFYQGVKGSMASKVARSLSDSEDFAFDAFLGGSKIKIASLDDLFSFDRVASDTLIHKSSKELWSIDTDEDGQTYIAKLFDDDGSPLRV